MFCRFSALAVDDSTFLGLCPEKGQDLVYGVDLGVDSIREIRPIETGHVTRRIPQSQEGADVVSYPLRRCRSQRHDR